MKSPGSQGATHFWRHSESLLILIAFGMRVGFMLAQHTYQFSAVRNHFGFGFETGSIAGAIARGEGFSSPFGVPTGPTAWIGPAYPYLLAGIFKLFGIFSDTSAIAILTINCLFAAMTCWTIFHIAEEIFDRRTAWICGAMWAVTPFFFRYAITWVWDPPISAFLLSLGVLWAIRMENPCRRDWVRFGLLAGISALVNPALTTLFPILMVWVAWRLWRRGAKPFLQALTALATMLLCISPWLVRNRIVFGQWVFLRSNAPFEFSLGNYPNSEGAPFAGRAPVTNPRVLDQYRKLGELGFVKFRGDEAMAWVKSHPADFAKLTLKRAVDFWDGGELRFEPLDDPWRPWMVSLESGLAFAGLWLGLRRGVRNLGPIILMMIAYPLPYYLIYTNPRYRHAIVPLLVVLIGYPFAAVWTKLRSREEQRTAATISS